MTNKQEIESIKRTLLNHIETDHVSRTKALERALESSAAGWRAVRLGASMLLMLASTIVCVCLTIEQPVLCVMVSILSVFSLSVSAIRFLDAFDDWITK